MSVITVTIPSPGGTATMTDTTAVAIAAQTLVLQQLWGAPGLKIPGSPISMMQVQAQSINDMASMMASMMEQQKEMTASIDSIRTSLAGVSSHIASGVTTQQIALTEQIKNNKFTQQTTNDALKRADLPPTEVLPSDLVDSTKILIQDVSMVKGQTCVAGLVEDNISKAATWTTTIVSDYISESFIGAAARTAKQTIKGWLKIEDPPKKAAIAETNAVTRNIKTVPVETKPLPPEEIIST